MSHTTVGFFETSDSNASPTYIPDYRIRIARGGVSTLYAMKNPDGTTNHDYYAKYTSAGTDEEKENLMGLLGKIGSINLGHGIYSLPSPSNIQHLEDILWTVHDHVITDYELKTGDISVGRSIVEGYLNHFMHNILAHHHMDVDREVFTDLPVLVQKFSDGQVGVVSTVRKMEGDNLWNIVKNRDGKLSSDQLFRDLASFQGISKVLHLANRYGVLHRDLSPNNIMEDASGYLRLVDFGQGLFKRVTGETNAASYGMYISKNQAEILLRNSLKQDRNMSVNIEILSDRYKIFEVGGDVPTYDKYSDTASLALTVFHTITGGKEARLYFRGLHSEDGNDVSFIPYRNLLSSIANVFNPHIVDILMSRFGSVDFDDKFFEQKKEALAGKNIGIYFPDTRGYNEYIISGDDFDLFLPFDMKPVQMGLTKEQAVVMAGWFLSAFDSDSVTSSISTEEFMNGLTAMFVELRDGIKGDLSIFDDIKGLLQVRLRKDLVGYLKSKNVDI